MLNDVRDRVKELERQNEPPTTNETTHFSESSSHFRQLPIIPNIADIIYDERPVLYPNIIDGSYETVEQYLNVRQRKNSKDLFFVFLSFKTHFRLLREDFLYPLREGIQQYLSKSASKNMNIRIYENVGFSGTRITRMNGLVYDFLLDRRMTSKIRWTNSQRLIYGNLLLISSDHFRSCTFFTIEDRSKLEKDSIISVEIFLFSFVFCLILIPIR